MIGKTFTKVGCVALVLAMPSIALTDESNKVSAGKTPVVNSKGVVFPDAAGKTVNKKSNDQTVEKRKQITSEALSAVDETKNALKALDEGKNDDAIQALERVTGKLELILARDANLSLAPINVSEATYDLYGTDTDKVMAARVNAEDLLTAGKVQEARLLLDELRSETVISVSNIPLATYPDAIKKAVKLIDDGKTDEAKEALQTALNTLVVTDTVIPLPVVAAQDALKDAKKLSEKSNRDTVDNKKLGELLDEAHSELEFAQALGYGSSNDFENLYAEMDVIKSKTSDGKSGKGFFDEIEMSLAKLFKTIQPQKTGA